MDYCIRRGKGALVSSGYIEVAAGQYSGAHGRDGSLFVREDAFAVVEGVIAKHLPSYEHAAMNDVPKAIGSAIVSEWREVAEWLPVMKPDEARVALNLGPWFGASFDSELTKHSAEVVELLRGLADGCDDFYAREEWICVLGA